MDSCPSLHLLWMPNKDQAECFQAQEFLPVWSCLKLRQAGFQFEGDHCWQSSALFSLQRHRTDFCLHFHVISMCIRVQASPFHKDAMCIRLGPDLLNMAPSMPTASAMASSPNGQIYNQIKRTTSQPITPAKRRNNTKVPGSPLGPPLWILL